MYKVVHVRMRFPHTIVSHNPNQFCSVGGGGAIGHCAKKLIKMNGKK